MSRHKNEAMTRRSGFSDHPVLRQLYRAERALIALTGAPRQAVCAAFVLVRFIPGWIVSIPGFRRMAEKLHKEKTMGTLPAHKSQELPLNVPVNTSVFAFFEKTEVLNRFFVRISREKHPVFALLRSSDSIPLCTNRCAGAGTLCCIFHRPLYPWLNRGDPGFQTYGLKSSIRKKRRYPACS